jgi:probable HAF family extracellular repeat protein
MFRIKLVPNPRVAGVLWALCFALAAHDAAAQYSFTSIDYPGAVWTDAFKINDSGQVVGQYLSASGVRHGYLKSGATYTTIDCPSPYTAASGAFGINSFGDIVGYCSTPGGINGFYGTSRSFLLSGGVLTLLPDPGSYGGASSQAFDINDSGVIAGWYADTCLCMGHGFSYSGGVYTTIDVAGSGNTIAYGINNLGQVVGSTQLTFGANNAHGFLLSGGVYTTFDDPDANQTFGAPGTDAGGINDAGQIVGTFVDSGSSRHGFLLDGGVFTTIDRPGAVLTEALGINSQGNIVGVFVDLAGVAHGFVTAPTYTAAIRPPVDADGTSVFNAKRGVIPVKFTLESNGVPTCQLPPATISLLRTAGGTVGPVNTSDYIQPADNGVNFRVDAGSCQYVYNLGSSSLGVGTYQVHISIDGISVGTGTFSLK